MPHPPRRHPWLHQSSKEFFLPPKFKISYFTCLCWTFIFSTSYSKFLCSFCHLQQCSLLTTISQLHHKLTLSQLYYKILNGKIAFSHQTFSRVPCTSSSSLNVAKWIHNHLSFSLYWKVHVLVCQNVGCLKTNLAPMLPLKKWPNLFFHIKFNHFNNNFSFIWILSNGSKSSPFQV